MHLPRSIIYYIYRYYNHLLIFIISLFLFSPDVNAEMTYKDFNRVKESIKKLYSKNNPLNENIYIWLKWPYKKYPDDLIYVKTQAARYPMFSITHEKYSKYPKTKQKIPVITILIKDFLPPNKGIDKDIFAQIICHELGHHIGGDREIDKIVLKKTGLFAEGQADYWSTNICLKKYYQKEKLFIRNIKIPQDLADKCDAQYHSEDDKLICYKTVETSLKVGLYLTTAIPPDYTKKAMPYKKEHFIFFDHPDAQCRLDTFLAGVFSEDRPRCWYNP